MALPKLRRPNGNGPGFSRAELFKMFGSSRVAPIEKRRTSTDLIMEQQSARTIQPLTLGESCGLVLRTASSLRSPHSKLVTKSYSKVKAQMDCQCVGSF